MTNGSLYSHFKKLNEDAAARQEFLDSQNPAALVKRDTGIDLSPAHSQDLKKMIDELKLKHANLTDLPPKGPSIYF